MGYILHIDTSADTSGVAISRDGKLITIEVNMEARNHASAINNMIENVLRKEALKMAELDAVAVCSGPGSYTGLRIAMATAKGICYALDIPLILNDRLQLMAGKDTKRYDSATSFASVLLAREEEYFMAIYNREGDIIVSPSHFSAKEMTEILKFHEKLHITSSVPEDIFYKLKVSFLSLNQDITLDFHYWSTFSFNQFQQKQFADISYAVPQYLKQVYTHK